MPFGEKGETMGILETLKKLAEELQNLSAATPSSSTQTAKKPEQEKPRQEEPRRSYEPAVSDDDGNIFEGTCDAPTCRQRILNVLAKEFPSYSVTENVSPHTIGGTGKFMNYSIGIYSGDQPKLFIMIIGKTTATHREYRWAKEAAERAGVTMINFISFYPNKTAYISERLHKYL